MPIVVQFTSIQSWIEALANLTVTVYQAMLDREITRPKAGGDTHHLCSIFTAVNHATNTIYGLTIPQVPLAYDGITDPEINRKRREAAAQRHYAVAGEIASKLDPNLVKYRIGVVTWPQTIPTIYALSAASPTLPKVEGNEKISA
jgi:hypothetical protein